MAFSRQELMCKLDELSIQTTVYDHEAVFTVAESNKVNLEIPGGHTKNLFLKDKKGKLFLVVTLSDAIINLKKIHTIIGGQGRVSFGNAELLEEVLGIKPGSVTPFSLINDTEQRVTPILDSEMMSHDLLNYHPLTNCATITIKRDDLIKFIQSCGHEPRILAVSENDEQST